MTAALQQTKKAPWPVLRRDIEIVDAGFDISGEQGLVLHDPIRHRFFRLPASTASLLEHLKSANSNLPETEDVKELAEFLMQNRLTDVRKGMAEGLDAEHQRGQQSALQTALHNYISFRIPLVRPERFLDATLPYIRPLASRLVFFLLGALTLVGGYFASRQWDHFIGMLWSSFTVAGAFNYAITLFVLKVFHELGHAYVARYFGCRVPSIGVAFMVMTPMLYTDATDAWRLSSRRKRFLIGAAGVLVEMGIAAIALFLWAFLPDGSGRAIAFFVAVTAWITSLLVNLSPFMRFDGYHMMVDALGMHSLGPRSFALANWRLREFLFKPVDAPPEFFAPFMRRFLIVFAYATWLYRFLLFMGIAWLLYTTLPKAAGVPLALVEIYYFILLPITRELKAWKIMGLKNLFLTPRAMITFTMLVGLVVISFLPLDRKVHVPTVVLPALEARIYPPESAQVVEVFAQPGDHVRKDQELARLFVPDIGHLQHSAQLRLNMADGQLRRIAADRKYRAEFLVLQQQRQTALAELDGLHQRAKLMVLKAPFSGIVTGDAVKLKQGQWVGQADLLFQLVEEGQGRMVGLLQERDAGRLAVGSSVKFIAADGVTAALQGKVIEVGLPGSEGTVLPYLISQFGGPIPTDISQQAKTPAGFLPLVMTVEAVAVFRAQAGTAVVVAEPQSFMEYMVGRIATVAMRESGF